MSMYSFYIYKSLSNQLYLKISRINFLAFQDFLIILKIDVRLPITRLHNLLPPFISPWLLLFHSWLNSVLYESLLWHIVASILRWFAFFDVLDPQSLQSVMMFNIIFQFSLLRHQAQNLATAYAIDRKTQYYTKCASTNFEKVGVKNTLQLISIAILKSFGL